MTQTTAKDGVLSIEKLKQQGMFSTAKSTQELFEKAVADLAAKENFWNTIKPYYQGEDLGDKFCYLDENVQVLVVVQSNLQLLHDGDFLLTVLQTLNTKGISALIERPEVGRIKLLDIIVLNKFPPIYKWPEQLKDLFFKEGK